MTCTHRCSYILTATASALVCASGASAGLAFAPSATLPVGQAPSGLVVGDFNADGNRDFAVSTDAPDRVEVYLGDGMGGFAPGPVTFLPAGVGAGRMVAANLDTGPSLDIAISFQNTNAVAILINNGAGLFANAGSFPVGANPRGIDAADVDSDNDTDLAVANRDGNSVSVLTNTGAGFAVVTLPAGVDCRDAVFGDVDGDTDPDLIVSNNDSDSLSVFLNAGGAFAPAPALLTGPPLSPEGVAVGHFNNDMNLDVVAATSGNGLNRLSVFLGMGGGAFAPAVHYPVTGVDPSSLAVMDFDCDGDADVAVTNTDSGNITVMLNNGAGVFAAGATLTAGLGVEEIASDDFDSAGGPDILAANRDGNSVTLALNQSCDAPCPGDANGDLVVNFTDLNIVLSDFGMTGMGLQGDVNDDGVVNFTDLNIVLSFFGTAC